MDQPTPPQITEFARDYDREKMETLGYVTVPLGRNAQEELENLLKIFDETSPKFTSSTFGLDYIKGGEECEKYLLADKDVSLLS